MLQHATVSTKFCTLVEETCDHLQLAFLEFCKVRRLSVVPVFPNSSSPHFQIATRLFFSWSWSCLSAWKKHAQWCIGNISDPTGSWVLQYQNGLQQSHAVWKFLLFFGYFKGSTLSHKMTLHIITGSLLCLTGCSTSNLRTLQSSWCTPYPSKLARFATHWWDGPCQSSKLHSGLLLPLTVMIWEWSRSRGCHAIQSDSSCLFKCSNIVLIPLASEFFHLSQRLMTLLTLGPVLTRALSYQGLN